MGVFRYGDYQHGWPSGTYFEAEILKSYIGIPESFFPGLFITELHVHEELRGKGVGCKLIYLLEAIAEKNGCKTILGFLEDKDVYPFYEKNGFLLETFSDGCEEHQMVVKHFSKEI